MGKWKFFVYPVWNFDKIESFLSKMEKQGYKVEKRRFSYFFKFKKANSKDVRYLLTYSPLGGSISMNNLEMQLKNKYMANIIIKGSFEAPAVYRISDTTNDISDVKIERNCILCDICKNKIFWSGLFVACIGLMCGLFKINAQKDLISCAMFLAPIIAYFFYNLVGFLMLKNTKL